MKKRIVVVALGGNALTPRGSRGTYDELARNIQISAAALVPLATKCPLVLVHGSGPQIGNLIFQNELSKGKIAPMPLHVLDAELEGELGYLLAQSLANELQKHNIHRSVVTIITQVLVDKRDPMFKKPTKPIGPFYSRAEARRLERKGILVINDAQRGYREVVPSPKPKAIIEARTIQSLVRQGNIVIAAGGGGIPVYKEKNKLQGIAAVIDKDFAAACVARDIRANTLLILTGVPNVYLHYKKNNQTPLKILTARKASQYLAQGEFPEGSMGPKMEAAIDFLAHGGEKVIITSPERLHAALKGKAGTVITR